MDEKTEQKVLEVIEKEFIQRNYTVVMVTHRLEAVRGTLLKKRVGDLVVSMDGGKVVGVEKVGEDEGKGVRRE